MLSFAVKSGQPFRVGDAIVVVLLRSPGGKYTPGCGQAKVSVNAPRTLAVARELPGHTATMVCGTCNHSTHHHTPFCGQCGAKQGGAAVEAMGADETKTGANFAKFTALNTTGPASRGGGCKARVAAKPCSDCGVAGGWLDGQCQHCGAGGK